METLERLKKQNQSVQLSENQPLTQQPVKQLRSQSVGNSQSGKKNSLQVGDKEVKVFRNQSDKKRAVQTVREPVSQNIIIQGTGTSQ